MRILLIGEYSRLHNSLKEGLLSLGHEVFIIGNGDGFKNFPVDLSTKAKWSETKFGILARKIVYRLTHFDFIKIEFGIRFYFYLNELKNFDIVQLINEAPIQTTSKFEKFLLKKIFQQNKKVFLLCCGVDYLVAKYMIEKTPRYSIMNPYFEGKKTEQEYRYILEYLKKSHKKIHHLVYKNIQGVIASDLDYMLPLKNNSKFLGLIPNPINTKEINYSENCIKDKVVLFLGINRGTYFTKGIFFFEKALAVLKEKYDTKIEILITENLPYQEYIIKYNKAHIILDQVYAFDQGYNALEAMAKGKVVFTGAEAEFEAYYKLNHKVAINALPDVEYLVKELSYLIENPSEIQVIGNQAKAFIEKEHNYLYIADKYFQVWNK